MYLTVLQIVRVGYIKSIYFPFLDNIPSTFISLIFIYFNIP